jgi:tripeptidyl-peptidase-1
MHIVRHGGRFIGSFHLSQPSHSFSGHRVQTTPCYFLAGLHLPYPPTYLFPTLLMAPNNRLRILALTAATLPLVSGAFHERWTTTPKGWVAANRPRSTEPLTVTIALTMRNIDQLESKLLSIATPGSSQYGQYMDVEDMQAAFNPSPSTVSSVTSWLDSHKIYNYTVDGAFVDVTSDVGTFNTLLNASYQYYVKGGVTKLRTGTYTIPDEVQQDIVLFYPGLFLGDVNGVGAGYDATTAITAVETRMELENPVLEKDALAPLEDVATLCQSYATPACLKAMYNFGNYTPDATSGSKVAFGNFYGMSTILSDLYAWEKDYDIPQQGFEEVLIAGGQNPQNATLRNILEPNLDAQTVVGIVNPLPVSNQIVGGAG